MLGSVVRSPGWAVSTLLHMHTASLGSDRSHLIDKFTDYMHTASLGRRDGLISAQVTTSIPIL